MPLTKKTISWFLLAHLVAFALFAEPVNAQLRDKFDALVSNTVKRLVIIGFNKESILVKDSILSGKRYALIRARSDKRVYDLSV